MDMVLAGILAVSTIALFSTSLRRFRFVNFALWAIMLAEVALLAALLLVPDMHLTQGWASSVLLFFAGVNVVLWLSAVFLPRDDREDEDSQRS